MTARHETSPPAEGFDPGQSGEYWLFEQLSAEQVQQIVARAKRWTAEPNRVICLEGDPGDSMFIIVSGRVKITTVDGQGKEVLLNQLDVGDHFGELAILTGDRRSATASAVVTTELMELSGKDFLHFVHHMPRFAVNISRVISRWLFTQSAGLRPQPVQSVALFRFSELAQRLAFELTELWRPTVYWMTVVTDRAEAWEAWLDQRDPADLAEHGVGLVPFGDGEKIRIPATSMEHKVLIDLAGFEGCGKALDKAEQVWIALAPQDVDGVVDQFKKLLGRREHLENRTRFLWCYDSGQRPPAVLRSKELTRRPTACLRAAATEQGDCQIVAADTQRLLRNLQGVDIGLALGGGGGRGLAHLGVLKAFEEHGIHFDCIAGTSVGALAAIFYAAGIPPDETLEQVTGDMEPPRWLRWLPKHKQWFMLWAFRFGFLERRFRHYLEDVTLEEMFTSIYTVCVDLVRGREVIRDRGDAVRAALESINHPGMGRPLMGDGEALVDGGVLINLPANVLRERGCEYIVSVDIGSHLEARFAGNTPDTPPDEMRRPGYFETLFRTTEVQMSNLASIHGAESDFLIQPKTSQFSFEDFTAGQALFDAGYEATIEAIPKLTKEIEKLMWSVEE